MKIKQGVKLAGAIIIIGVALSGALFAAGLLFFLNNGENPLGKVGLFSWLEYWRHYYDNAVVREQLLKAMAFPALGFGALGFVFVYTLYNPKQKLHGQARFASKREIEAAGLFASTGIIVGKFRDKIMMFPGAQFVLLLAPTRSGKGVGVVIPNCLAYQDSMAILDVKGENFDITSKYRQQNGQKVFKFSPFDTQTHRYNMLGYISDDPNKRVAEILSLGYALFPGEGKDSFFDDAARNLFLGLSLYLLETPTLPNTMGELLRQSSGKGKPIKKYLDDIINDRNFVVSETIGDDGAAVIEKVPKCDTDLKKGELPPLSDECVEALSRFMGTSDNTLSSILASFNTPLTLWASPIVDAATSDNDFDLRSIRKERTTIYVVIPANKLAEAELILNVFFTQLVNLNTDKLLNATPEIKYPCLLLMDEFTAPGKIKVIDKSIAFLAGYGLRMVTIAQSIGQLEAEPKRGYGREGARTLVTNHALQIMYTPREQADAETYSKMLGTYTYQAISKARMKHLEGTVSEQSRALMMPQELRELPQSKELISLENTKPILCEKIRYYQEPVFVRRLQSVASSLKTPFYRRFPTQNQLETAAGSGELSSPVPTQDLDLHKARVQQRIRPLTADDLANGIDLKDLALDTKVFETKPAGDSLSEAEVAAMVNNFFDNLDSAQPIPVAEEAPEPQELPFDSENAIVIDLDDIPSDEPNEPTSSPEGEPPEVLAVGDGELADMEEAYDLLQDQDEVPDDGELEQLLEEAEQSVIDADEGDTASPSRTNEIDLSVLESDEQR